MLSPLRHSFNWYGPEPALAVARVPKPSGSAIMPGVSPIEYSQVFDGRVRVTFSVVASTAFSPIDHLHPGRVLGARP